MNEPKFTSGPWSAQIGRWNHDSPAYGFRIAAPKKLAAVAGVALEERNNAICGIQPTPASMADEFYTPEELEANARLIAAAPDLYVALSLLVDDDECSYDHHGYCQTHNLGNPCGVMLGRRALAKAVKV